MSMKMEPTGGPAIGVTWDDGAHTSVREIQISHDAFGINFVKFEYLDAKKTETGELYYKIGNESHGKKSYHPAHTTEEFQLKSYEYITEVETYVRFSDNVVGNVITFVFKTNKRTSKAYGLDPLSYGRVYKKIVLGEKNKKIVGFHGNSGERVLHAIGVYVCPEDIYS